MPIECKASLQVKPRHIRNILYYLKAAGQQVGILVSAAPVQTIHLDGKTVINLPVYMASREVIRTFVEREMGD